MQYEDARETYTDFYQPQFKVELGTAGKRLVPGARELTVREHHGVISDLTVDATLDGADRFSFTLVDAFDLRTRSFRKTAWERFAPTTPVRVSLGYDGRLVPLLDGRIESVQPEFPAGSLPTLEVSGYDRLHELTKGTGETDFEDVTMADVVLAVVEGYGFGPSHRNLVVTNPNGLTLENLKRETNDYDFLREHARRYNHELFTRIDPEGDEGDPEVEYKNRLYFRSPEDDAGDLPGDALVLRYGESLRSFSVESNRATQVPGVVLRHRQPRRGIDITVTAPEGTPEDTEGLKQISTPVSSAEEGRLVAAAELDRLRQERVTGSGEVVGLPNLRIGTLLELDGIGRFSEPYYVTGVTHRIGQSGYTTNFAVRLASGTEIQGWSET